METIKENSQKSEWLGLGRKTDIWGWNKIRFKSGQREEIKFWSNGYVIRNIDSVIKGMFFTLKDNKLCTVLIKNCED